jgi:hypothetical protein
MVSVGTPAFWRASIGSIACLTSRLAGPTGARRNGNGLGWQLSFVYRFSQLFPASGNDFIQVFRQIFGEVPAIGHVRGFGKGLCNSGSKLLGPILRHDLDRWVGFQPVCDRRLRAISKQGNRLLAFQIHDNGPIALTASPRPLVEANDPRRSDERKRKIARTVVCRPSSLALRAPGAPPCSRPS